MHSHNNNNNNNNNNKNTNNTITKTNNKANITNISTIIFNTVTIVIAVWPSSTACFIIYSNEDEEEYQEAEIVRFVLASQAKAR